MSQKLSYKGFTFLPDPLRLFSLSYRGHSSRLELVLMLVIISVTGFVLRYSVEPFFWTVELPAGALEHNSSITQATCNITAENLFIMAAWLLFLLPLSFRRGRQAGWSPWLNVSVLVICLAGANELWDSFHAPFLWELHDTLMHASTRYCLVLLLPLCFYGGRFCGEKTALMRAAIAGDEERARQEIEANPQVLHLRSKRGDTARSYAEKSGHAALADVLRSLEQEHPASPTP